jgi:hypothetical protein
MWKKTLDTLPQNVWHVEGYPVKSTPEIFFRVASTQIFFKVAA